MAKSWQELNLEAKKRTLSAESERLYAHKKQLDKEFDVAYQVKIYNVNSLILKVSFKFILSFPSWFSMLSDNWR